MPGDRPVEGWTSNMARTDAWLTSLAYLFSAANSGIPKTFGEREILVAYEQGTLTIPYFEHLLNGQLLHIEEAFEERPLESILRQGLRITPPGAMEIAPSLDNLHAPFISVELALKRGEEYEDIGMGLFTAYSRLERALCGSLRSELGLM